MDQLSKALDLVKVLSHFLSYLKISRLSFLDLMVWIRGTGFENVISFLILIL